MSFSKLFFFVLPQKLSWQRTFENVVPRFGLIWIILDLIHLWQVIDWVTGALYSLASMGP